MNTIKKFIHYYGPYKAVFFIDLICAAVISLVDLAYPQILRTMTKTLFTQDKDIILHALPVIAASLFVMYIVQSLCKYYVTCQGHMMGAKMERDMRRELFDHYQELSFSYYSRNNSGQMMSKLVSDLFDISEFAHHGPENLFISLVKIVGAFIFLFFINKKLALPLILLVIVMFVFSFRQTNDFMEQLEKMLTFLLPLYAEEGKSALVIAIGCTGGHHRSVAVAHELAEYITEEGYQVTENHRDISR